MTNAIGQFSIVSLTVTQSDVALTIGNLSNQDLNQPFIYVNGSIDAEGYTVWVNGVQATLYGGGTWGAVNVPVCEGGTAVIQARAIPSSEGGTGKTVSTMADPGNPSSPQARDAEADPDKPPIVVQVEYDKLLTDSSVGPPPASVPGVSHEDILWDFGMPGHWWWDDCYGPSNDEYFKCDDAWWDWSGTGMCSSGIRRGPGVCGVRTYDSTGPYAAPSTWPGEFCKVSAHRSLPWENGQVITEDRSRTARTRYLLHTGGKGNSTRQNLFVLSAQVQGVGDPFWPEVDTEDDYAYGINPAAIVLGEFGLQGSDGLIYKVLSDNTIHDITPRVPGNPYYTFTEPVANKHKLVSYTLHQALSDPRRDRTTLGVGELVSIYFEPELDMTFPETPTWLPFDGSVTPNVGSWVIFTAPSNAVASTTVRVFVRDVHLDKYFSVVAPSGWDHADIVSTNHYPIGMSAGDMQLRVFFAPTEVSLYRVEIEEVGTEATGVWGAFVGHLMPHISDTFRGLNDNNSWNVFDNCGGGAPYGYPGGFTWIVPAKWRIPGGPTNSMTGWDQEISIDAAGTYKVDKFGRWVQRTIDDVITTH